MRSLRTNAASIWSRASPRGQTRVTATRRPPAAESRRLAARRASLGGASRARSSSRRSHGGPALGHRSVRRHAPSACERGVPLAPCFSARSHPRDRNPTAASRRVAVARRSVRRRSAAPLAPVRPAAALTAARHLAAAQCGGTRPLRANAASLWCRASPRAVIDATRIPSRFLGYFTILLTGTSGIFVNNPPCCSTGDHWNLPYF